MNEKTCATCAHWGAEKPFGAYGIDFCCREDSTYYNGLMNADEYCKAWEPKEQDGKE